MAGYSGQEIALDVDTPSQLEQAAAQADLTQTQSQLAKATLPADIQYKQALATGAQQTNAQNALTLEQQTAEWGMRKHMADEMAQRRQSMGSSLAQAPQGGAQASSPLAAASDESVSGGQPQQTQSPTAFLFGPQIDQVMHSINPNDPQAAQKWDEQMSALGKDDAVAQQFVGNYSREKLRGWLQQTGANAVKQATQNPQTPLAQGSGPATSPLASYGQPGDQSGVVRSQAGQVVSPLTGQPDEALTEYADLFPDKAAAMIKQQGLLKYISTGDIGVLKRFDPDEYAKLVEAQKNLNEAQKVQIQTKAATMGSSAFAFLGVARQYGVNSDQARGAWTRAITEAANDGFMDAGTARQRIAQGPDLGFATESYLRAMTVAEAMKATGIEEENIQRAKVNNPAIEYRTVRNADGSESVVQVGGPDAAGNGVVASGAGGAGGPTMPTGPFDAKQFFHDFVLPHEGGFAAHDANGAPVNMGINQSANPGVDIRKLTPDQAANIFATKYAAKAVNLPPAMAAAYSDTAFINPGRADQFLAQSGGDVGKFLALRTAWQNNLVATDPDKYKPYEKAWANRNADLAKYVSSVGGYGPASGGASGGGARVVYQSSGVGGDNIEAQAQAIANGMQPPITGRAAVSGVGATIMGRVYGINPTYDAKSYTPQVAALKSFTSGSDSKTVQALSNAGQHLSQLNGLVDALNNHDNQTINRIGNAFSAEFGGTAPTDFNAVRQMVGGEIAKVIAGGVSGEGDRRQAEAWLSSANSPAQLKSAIIKVEGLLGSQANTLRNKYEVGTGRKDFDNLLAPEVRNIWGKSAHANSGNASGGIPAGARPVTGPKGQRGYVLNGKLVIL